MKPAQLAALIGFLFVDEWASLGFGDALLCLLGAAVFYAATAFYHGELDLSNLQQQTRSRARRTVPSAPAPDDSCARAAPSTSKGAVMATQTNPGQPAAGQAQEKAQAAAGQAQAKVREQLDQRSSQLAEHAHQQASDRRSVSEALRDQGKDRPAQAVDRLAGYAEQAGSYLRDTDADSMLSDAEDFGRRKPAAVAAGALALGLVASRFLKASSSRRYSTRQTQQPRPMTTAHPEMPATPEPPPVTPSPPPAARPGI